MNSHRNDSASRTPKVDIFPNQIKHLLRRMLDVFKHPGVPLFPYSPVNKNDYDIEVSPDGLYVT
jgi:hypothetical protein